MDYDIAIIGAGPVGLSFACSLRDSGLQLVVIDSLSKSDLENPKVDGRDIALTHHSRELMKAHGSWQHINPKQISAIKRAEVYNGNSTYTLNFDSAGQDPDGLGFLISNHHIRESIFAQFKKLKNVTLMDDSAVSHVSSHDQHARVELASGEHLEVAMVVAADTRFSNCRRQMGIAADSHDFGRTAIVCEMSHALSHEQTAFECFHYGRTLAILPMPGKVSSIVVTAPTDQVTQIMQKTDEQFCQEIEQRLQGKLGKMQMQGQRYEYPLVGVHATRFYANRFALIGDAAVGMHPVTAHGFNLGLSGQHLLANEMIKANNAGQKFWATDVLKRYQYQHMLSTRPLYHGTNAVVGLFTNDSFPATLLRKLAMRLSNNLPPIKWAIEQQLMSKKPINQMLLPNFLR